MWRDRLSDKSSWRLVSLVLLAILCVTFVMPATWMFIFSIRQPEGGLGFANYLTIIADPLYVKPLINTLRVGISATLLSLVIGIPLAWFCARTDMPGTRVLRVVVFLSFIFPPFLGAVAWVLLASPNAGLLNQAWEALFGIKPFDIFNLSALSFVIAAYLYPYTFVFVVNTFDTIGAEIEEAGAISGAGPLRRALTIVLPLALPAILGSAMLVFLQSVSLFGAPAIIAIPAGQHVLSTQIFLLFAYPAQPELAAAFGMPLVLLAFTFLYLRRRAYGRRSFTTIGGQGSRAYRLNLGVWRWPASGLAWLVVTITSLLPAAVLLYISVLERWTAPLGGFTFAHFLWVAQNAVVAFQNTIVFSAAAATLCVLLGFLVAYLNSRHPSLLNRLLEMLATAPIVLPGVVLAVAMFAAYSRAPLYLVGTAYIVILVFVGRFLPVALESISPAIASVHHELEQASRGAGAGMMRTLRKITMPLAGSGLVAGWLFAFILSMQELSAAVLLVSIRTELLSTKVINLYGYGSYERVAAIGAVMVAVTVACIVLGLRVVGRSFIMRGK